MTLDAVDPILTPPKRLAAMGILAGARSVEFAFIRDHLGLSDSDLSKQMRALTEAGYATSTKRGTGRHRTTWFRATAPGRKALSAHVAALNALVEAAPTADDRPRPPQGLVPGG